MIHPMNRWLYPTRDELQQLAARRAEERREAQRRKDHRMINRNAVVRPSKKWWQF